MVKNLSMFFVCIVLMLSLISFVSAQESISFLYEDSFIGVDDTTGFSNDNSTNNLNKNTLDILNNYGKVYGYENGDTENLSHRGTRGLGIWGKENDEVDTLEKEERIEIEFDSPYYINYIEIRSLYAHENQCSDGDEEGYIKYYLGDSEVANENPIGEEAEGTGNDGSWDKNYEGLLIDKIKFYAPDDGCSDFSVARFNISEYEPEPEVSPTCSVDYLDKVGNSAEYYFNDSIYISDTGGFLVKGAANVEEPYFISWVGYNRTSPNDDEVYNLPIGSWSDTEGYNLENWKSDDNDASFVEGWHTVCCKSQASECQSCEEYASGEPNCTTFCLDETNPPQVENVRHSNPGECVPEYINNAPEFKWDAVEDEGCAGLDRYKVKLYFSNGTYIDKYYVNETNFSVPEEELINGEDYYITVRAEDKAGNPGDYSEASEHVYYDNENPVVEITKPEPTSWFNNDFYVNETDEDNEDNLWKCYFRLVNEGELDSDWIETNCNEEFSVNISEYCPEDSLCTVHKKAIDKACNEYSTYRPVYLDRKAPETTKIVSDPKHPGEDWMGWMLDWFIKDTTELYFDGDDGEGVGCNITHIVIYNSSGEVVYENHDNSCDKTVLMDFDDGVYNVTYWSVDKLGNTEEIKSEIDKVDIESPTTEKNYIGPELWGWRVIPEFNLKTWMRFISYDTQITLDASDEEVGVDKTYFGILVPSNTDTEHPEAYLEGEWYEQGSEEFENCVEEYKDMCGEENTIVLNGENKDICDTTTIEEYCNITYWKNKYDCYDELDRDFYINNIETECPPYIYQHCGEDMVYNEEHGLWMCPYEEPINIEKDCDHKICYFSEDKLGNKEKIECQVFSVDGDGPNIRILNPSISEAGSVKGCSLDVLVETYDNKSGINGTEVLVNLTSLNEDGSETNLGKLDLVSEENGRVWNGDMYENVFDISGHKAGEYKLEIIAEDNLGNKRIVTRTITLESGIFVDRNNLPSCSVGTEGGICELEFHSCIRNSTEMDFYMSKLNSGSVSPLKLDAILSVGENSGKAGLLNSTNGYETIADKIALTEDCSEVNGWKDFKVSLNFTEELIDNLMGEDYNEEYRFTFNWTTNSYINEESCIN